MTIVCIDPIPRGARHYRLPELLHDIRLIDLLELCGTTVRASQLLNLSQPTVSRRYRILAGDFGLKRDPRSIHRCRYGSSQALRLLRLGCRAHRLAAGVARLGTDLFHQHLLAGCDWLLPVPSHCRSINDWAELVHQGVLDGALISGLELQAQPALPPGGFRLLELGRMRLALATADSKDAAIKEVLVPERSASLGLQRELQRLGFPLRIVAKSCASEQHWLERLTTRGTAMPIDPSCCDQGGWAQALQLRPLSQDLPAPVWLLLPKGHDLPGPLARTLEHLQNHPALRQTGV